MPDEHLAHMLVEHALDERLTRLETLLERALAYGRQTAIGKAIIAKLGLDDA